MNDLSPPAFRSVFVVSTVGQVTNASRVIDLLNISNPYFICLYTNQNTSLINNLANILDQKKYPYEKTELPRHPSLRLPWQVLTIARTYETLAKDYAGADLWIANINSHYGYLAHIFSTKGSQIKFFEEGMSTYLTASDPRFQTQNTSSFSTTAKQAVATLQNKKLRLSRRVLRIAKDFVNFAAMTKVGHSLSLAISRGKVRHFYEPWRQFDHVVATYPDLVDSRLINSDMFTEMPAQMDAKTLEIDLGALTPNAIEALLGPYDAVVISQQYAVDPTVWAQIISKALRSKGVSSILLKFHPREQKKERDAMLKGFKSCGVHVFEDITLDKYPVEALMPLCMCGNVIGLTSTSLMQLAATERVTHVASISFLLIAYLKDQNNQSLIAAQILELDTKLLERMSTLANADIEFWK